MHNKLLAIVGPTAVGKTDLALRLARQLRGEIVSADSRQVYRYMDIGTAKPTAQQRAEAPHHLVDIIDPDQEYSLALFLRQARVAIGDVQQRGRLPLLVGGTGQYVWGLLEGWQVPEAPPDPEVRRGLEERAAREGAAALYDELRRLDPEAASRIDPRNVRRVVRALEVRYISWDGTEGRPRKAPPDYDTLIIGLTLDRVELYRRIDGRVERMVEAGWVDEVRGLLERGYRPALPSMSSLGYGELAAYIQGKLALDEAVRRIKHGTHRFARHQYAWFRLRDPRIRWYDASEGWGPVDAEVRRWLGDEWPVVK